MDSKEKAKPKPDAAKADKPKPEKAKADKPKPEKAKADKAKPEKAKADKAKPEKAKADKTKGEKAKTDKPKTVKGKVEKSKADKAKAEKPKSTKARRHKTLKTKGVQPKSGKTKGDESKSLKRKTHLPPKVRKGTYKKNPIIRKKKAFKLINEGRVTKRTKRTTRAQERARITKVGKIRFGKMKRQIIKKILKPRVKKAADEGKKAPLYITKPIGGEKNGGTRTVLVKKPPAYYPTEVRKSRRPKQKKQYPCKLKKSLIPGALCIVLAGAHKGKRVVFLKQLQSGLCLVTGPFTLNRCPLRRISQNYLIGTSTKLKVKEDFKVPESIDDKYFKRVRLVPKKRKKDEGDIFATKAKKYVPSNIKKADQKTVDSMVMKAIKKTKGRKSLKAYMSCKFELRNHQFPHLLKF